MLKLNCWIAAAIAFSAVTLSQTMPLAAKQSCDRWTAAMEQREEGKAMTASVCATGADRDNILELVCFGDQINVRYLVMIKNDAEPKFQMQGVVFQSGNKRRLISMAYEGLDGAFAAYLPKSHPLFEMLMSGDQLELSATRDKLRVPAFTLRGSRKAISLVMSRCR